MLIKNLNISAAYQVKSRIAGPHVLCFGGVHGDEPCGVWAIKTILSKLEMREIQIIKGTLTLVIANERAIEKNVRFIEANLNRLFRDDALSAGTHYEAFRAAELKELIKAADYFLDLHSTSSETEPFITCEEELLSEACKLGIRNIVTGWGDLGARATLGDTETYAVRHGVKGFTMECGQHLAVSSNDIAYQSLSNFLGYTGLLEGGAPQQVSPIIMRIFHAEEFKDSSFVFAKKWENFTRFRSGDLIATESTREYRAPCDCIIVLPSYRNPIRVGEEAYLLAKEILSD